MGSYFALLAFSRAAENSDLRWASLLVTVLGEKEFCCLAQWYFALKGRSFRGKRGEPGGGVCSLAQNTKDLLSASV